MVFARDDRVLGPDLDIDFLSRGKRDVLLIEGDIGSERTNERTNRSVITRRTRFVAPSSRGETRSLVDVYLTAPRLSIEPSFPILLRFICFMHARRRRQRGSIEESVKRIQFEHGRSSRRVNRAVGTIERKATS